MSKLEFNESPIPVRVGEVLIWDFDISPWAASGSAPVVSAVRTDTGAEVTTALFGAEPTPTLVGTIYTLPPASGFTRNLEYRITAQFASGGNTLRPFFLVQVSA
jgi:hypothetical protein